MVREKAVRVDCPGAIAASSIDTDNGEAFGWDNYYDPNLIFSTLKRPLEFIYARQSDVSFHFGKCGKQQCGRRQP